MKTNRKFLKVLQREIYIALIMGILLAGVSPFYATPATAQAGEAPSLLSFTSGGHALGFSPQGMFAATGSHALRVDFVNANNVQPRADATTSADGKSASLGRVAYADLWEGISVEYTATADSIYTATYNLAPGADAKNIRLRYNAPLRVDEAGNLRIAFETGEMTESAPIAWQEIDGQRVAVPVAFRLLDSPIENPKSKIQNPMVSFALGKYDPRHALTIDPSLTWHTFLGGGAADDIGRAIAVDGSGNVYVAGNSDASWGSPVRDHSGGRDGFVAKLDGTSGNLLWNTFLGGGGLDAANGIAVDGNGDVYVVGDSDAAWICSNWINPYCTVNAYSGGTDAFAAQLTASGMLWWNTFIGWSETEYGTAIAIDTVSNPNVIWAAIDSNTHTDFRTDFDALAAKLDLSGNLVISSIRLGSAWNDYVNAIAVDGSGNVYVAGDSDATWGSPVRSHRGGVDAFAGKLDSSANLLWHTFLGGSGTDHGYGIAVDGSGNVYVAGESNAAWTCLDLFNCTVQGYFGVGTDFFAAKLDSSGHLDWNTFSGWSGNDSGKGIAVGGGNLYLTGNHWGYEWGAFASQFSSSGAQMASADLGGSGNDYGNGIAVWGGNAFVAGYSGASWGSPVRPYTPSGYDAFVAKVNFTTSTAFKSVGANDGWALESGENTNAGGTLNAAATTFNLGDDAANKQYRGILSFATGAGLPDNAIITKVTLKLRKSGITGGGNPVNTFQGFIADVKKGTFGTATLQATDFQAAANKSSGPFKPAVVGGWYSLNLTNAKGFINKLSTNSGLTQIRLRFKLDDNNNAVANYLSLFSGNAGAASRPQLIIEYYVP